MFEHFVAFLKWGWVLLVVVAILALVGCAQGRVLSANEASAYCAQNSAGRALGMNPFGEDYATWMAYCNQAWVSNTLPSMALGASIIQTQQALDQSVYHGNAGNRVTCYQQGYFTQCY